MSVVVKCTIEVSEQEYELGTENREAYTVSQHATSTGTFAEAHPHLLEKLIDGATERAAMAAKDKLKVLKG